MSDPTAFDGVRRFAADVVGLTLKAGVVVTKGFADTVSGKSQPPVAGEAPLLSMVRHTTTGLFTLARVAMDAARATGEPPSSNLAPESRPPQEPLPTGPSVAPGGNLTIPISVSNPGRVPMTELTPQVIGMTLDSAPVPAPQVRFIPPTLTIAPHDFEKIRIEINLPADMPEGVGRLSFAIGADVAANEIMFLVQA
jgi:hypothetical protein